jgi:hypothetical protein
VLFASGAITFYEGNNMLSALAKYMINRLIHDIFFGKKNHLHFYKIYSPSAYIKYKIFEKTINQHG